MNDLQIPQAAEEKKDKVSPDAELSAMRKIIQILRTLDADQASRVIHWAHDRWSRF